LREIETLAGVATGARWPEQWGSAAKPLDFYDVKADVESVLALTGDVRCDAFRSATLQCLRPGRARESSWRRRCRSAGSAKLHPQLVKALACRAPHFYLS
jgi:phenylalanyl-tRNA synthetase beta chain